MAIPQSITNRNPSQLYSDQGFFNHIEPNPLEISIPHIYSRPFIQHDVWQLKNNAAARNYEVALDRSSYETHFYSTADCCSHYRISGKIFYGASRCYASWI